MKHRILLTFIYAFALLSSSAAFSAPPRKIPYFASIRSEDAHIRTGPSVRYPIQWIYKRGSWPVEVTATFERWRKINDISGEVGWIHESLLTLNRNVIVNSKKTQEIYALPITSSAVILKAENGVVANLMQCKNDWCKISLEDKKGWIEEKYLWGVSSSEVVE